MNYKISASRHIIRILNILLLSITVNGVFFFGNPSLWYLRILSTLTFIAINIFPSFVRSGYPSFRLRMCGHGNELLIYFLFSMLISIALNITTAFYMLPNNWFQWVMNLVLCICLEAIVFWNGIISVYCSSVQLGIKQRVIGIIFGWIPIINLLTLGIIIKIVSNEVDFEIKKANLNKQRASEHICATKYPILLVHGVFFRDTKYFNYWGRIPKELEANGAVIFYGNHQSALSVEDSAKELADRIKQIVEETKCEKLNIIAHSKGGLDCRYAISKYDCAKYIASLTTINTPHKGCGFADYMLKNVSVEIKEKVADTYNSTLKKLGDKSPDFIAAISCLTEEYCADFNSKILDSSEVRYMSVGSKLNHAVNGKFPLNFSYPLVKHFDGPNDGLVSEKSFAWGESYTFLTSKGKRGISHGDMIDLNRENIDGFDVREFYVQLVSNLKKSGL